MTRPSPTRLHLEPLERRELLDGFVQADGTGFTLDGGPFYAAGANCYYLMIYAADPGLRDEVDEVLGEAAAMGLNTMRTWAFNDGAGEWNALQTAPGVYDETVFAGLDYVVQKAGELGLRLVLPFLNNWDAYGGMDQYVAWDATDGVGPETASEHDDFYTDSDTRQWYKDHVEAVITRVNSLTGVAYRDDPAIFAWELANEPRAMTDPTGDTLQAWIEEMAAHIRSLDPNHMVTTGIEGFYAGGGSSPAWMYDGSQGTDFIRNHQVADIDYATVHLYTDHWPGLDDDEADDWYAEHMQDARDVLGMPVVLEEFGRLRDPDGTSTTARDALYGELFDLCRAEDAAGWSFWALFHDDYRVWDDGFGVFVPDDASTVAVISDAAATLTSRAFTVAGQHTYDDGVTVTIVDMLPADGLAPRIAWSRAEVVRGATDILVDPGRAGDGILAAVTLCRTAPIPGIGILISGATKVDAMKDARRDEPPALAFLASDAPIRQVRLRSGLDGAALNGRTFGAFVFDADVDGDGETDDPVALYCAGHLRAARLGGAVNADVLVGGADAKGASCRAFATVGGGFHGDLTAPGDVGTVAFAGDFGSSLDIGGDLKRLLVTGGDLTGTVDVAGGLGSVCVRAARDRATRSRVGGSVTDARLTVAGLLKSVAVGGDFTDSDVDAGALRRVSVRGAITQTDAAGHEIRARAGSFTVRDTTWRGRIEQDAPHLFPAAPDGLTATVRAVD